jgi:hypothetical protein
MSPFLLVQMAHHTIEAPTKMCFLCLGPNVSNQSINMSLVPIGPCIPKVKKTWAQKLQLLLPVQFHLARLSFVSVTPLFKYHKKF